MLDIHCHLLPGIDDGPNNIEHSLQMARLAVENSINKAILTPHITPGRYDNTLSSISAVFSEFKNSLEENDIPFQIGMAAEVRLDPVIMELVNNELLPIIGNYQGYQLFLLEFPHQTIPPGSMELIKWLDNKKIKPIIAHPERNKSVINNLEKLKPFRESGCLFQITAGSLTGVFGDQPRQVAIKLLELEWADIIASDAHNLTTRIPDIEPGRKVAEEIVGEDNAWKMVRDFPEEIAGHHFI